MLWILFSLLAICIENSLYSPRLMYQTGFILSFTKKDISAVRTKSDILLLFIYGCQQRRQHVGSRFLSKYDAKIKQFHGVASHGHSSLGCNDTISSGNFVKQNCVPYSASLHSIKHYKVF